MHAFRHATIMWWPRSCRPQPAHNKKTPAFVPKLANITPDTVRVQRTTWRTENAAMLQEQRELPPSQVEFAEECVRVASSLMTDAFPVWVSVRHNATIDVMRARGFEVSRVNEGNTCIIRLPERLSESSGDGAW